ncbi:SRPBCC family protein [Flavilitoribacter nigricans]|uniref:ATPase n=1 Tax=Flavilitoribacter nigricans (strain ATCC 23147 / DSM 23189 / NBRC 102662 / NCIMB 1420 / SS-2) TaxID=1122177 RepID=A0A2D0MZM5_FLAN2|nr:SRPBCC domain-containing protein [Flavilitoribacter nigricans]PHN01576.1 ATPase [Flavilitoribacter nigricans DSM 23189 = NBRC 102662]
MSKAILFNFDVDKENKRVLVERMFDAPADLVWAAWTEAELLDQWWAPRPWRSKTKEMEFAVGGRRLYAMLGPEGEEHWALADYSSIAPNSNFQYLDAFCDEHGTINEDFPRSDWSIDFKPSGDATLVQVEIKHERLADLEKIIELGFREGFTIALQGLDDILPTLQKNR